MSAIGTKRTYLVAPHMSAFGGKADMHCKCLLLTQSGHSACASGCLLSGGSGHDFLTSLVANALAYFLSGLRFGDDVASRRFFHLVSDGLPLR